MERKFNVDYAFKLGSVNLVFFNHSYKYITILRGFNEFNSCKWVNFYMKYCEIGQLLRKNLYYNIDYKLRILKTIEAKNLY